MPSLGGLDRHRGLRATVQRKRGLCLGAAPDLFEGQTQRELDLRVHAAQVVRGPFRNRIMDGRVQPHQDVFTFGHQVYSEPVLTTGCVDWSEHNTTKRFETIADFLSSSSSTTSCSAIVSRAVWTIPTAPSTIC